MKDFITLLALPASLLKVVAVHAQELPWPHNLPRTARYYPEHEAHIKREVEAQEKLSWQAPAAVKKMGSDEGEKFFLHYWGFEEESNGAEETLDITARSPAREAFYSNTSAKPHLLAPIAPHHSENRTSGQRYPRNIFKRDFECPQDTKSCSSIGEDDLCCNLDETCVSTDDGVGCCPAGATCGKDVSGCDTDSGYTSCPNSPNGGCCIPEATCEGTGCVFTGTRTVTRTLSTAVETSPPTSQPTASISVSTETVTVSPEGYTTTRTVSVSGDSCSTGFFSCPSSLGGGCCANGQECGDDGDCDDSNSPTTSTTTSTTKTSATANAPVLPTSESNSPADEASTTTDTGACPTGFYMCSAVYLGGCCRVGRDCQTTSCPPQDSTTLISSGRTVFVTGPGDATATANSCANGWFLCEDSDNGGCCPSGYECGAASCTASGRENTGKMAPSSANVQRWVWSFVALGVIAAAGMVYL